MTELDASASRGGCCDRASLIHRMVQFFLLLGLVWKLGLVFPEGLVWKRGFFLLADEAYHRFPLDDPFFPDWLRSAAVIRWTYLTAVSAIVVNLFVPLRSIRLVAGVVSLVALSITCLHQASYNDMTFVTSWWVALWSLWFVGQSGSDKNDPRLIARAALLSRLIISMILLGGAIGKWTPEYWSGEVFFDIYFRDRDQWMFNWLREHYESETLQQMAMWYSRKVIVVETLGGFGLWLLPARWAAVIGMVLFFSIAALSNFWLFSVTWSMVGLAAVGLFVGKDMVDE